MTQPDRGDTPRELWVAYYPDWSEVVVFTNELAALRYAVDRHSGMWVGKALPGLSLREQLA